MDIEQYHDARLENIQKQINSLECTHPKKEVRYKLASNNSKMWKEQCIRCGETFGEWIPHKDITNPDERREIDDNLRNIYSQTCFELRKALQDRVNEINKKDFHEWYKAYLQSEDWHEKRRLVYDRCNGICEGCRLKRSTQVHHKTYQNVGNEFLFELLGVCKDCHERIHEEVENENTG